MPKRTKYDPTKINEILDDAWLNIDKVGDEVFNPLMNVPHDFSDEPNLYFLWLLSNPEYFSLFCKEILNITILPFQAVILKEMWNRRFPILIGSRGLGKSYLLALYCILRMVFLPGRKIVITGAGFRQSKIIFEYMEKIWYNSPLLRDIVGNTSSDRNGPAHGADMWRFIMNESQAVAIPIGCLEPNSLITTEDGIKSISSLRTSLKNVWGNGKYRKTEFFYDSGISPSIEVTTKRGFKYISTPNHKMKVCRDENIIWVRTDELKSGDRILIDRTERWHNGDTNASIEDAYTLGMMIGDGNWANQYFMRYTTIDKELRDAIQHIGNFTDQKDGLHYQCNGKEKRQEWLDFWNLESAYGFEKVFPEKILCSSKEKMTACLQGLFDTDGSVSRIASKGYHNTVISFSSTSEELVRTIQYILLHYGIISTVSFRDRKSPRTGNDAKRVFELYINGYDVVIFKERIGFRLSRKKELLEQAISNKIRFISSKDDYPIFDFCKKNIKSVVKDRKTVNRNHLDKINSYNLPDNIKEIANNDIYYDTVLLISKSIDRPMYDINIPEGNEYCANGFFSHNTGEKIRGQRAHDIIVDEFAVGDPNIFEHVISGFAAVSSNPVINVMNIARRRRAEEYGIELEDDADEEYQANQIILSGTAYYSFNHFHKYWRLWQGIVNSRGDRKKLAEIGADNNIDYRDYSVMRIPYSLIPEGLMEEAIVSRSRATMHNALYNMEFEAVFGDDSNGFFKRSLVEKCVDEHTILFEGAPNKDYVMAIDPAAENDNFCIIILQYDKTHKRVVYCWTTNRKNFKQESKDKRTDEDTFYDYAAVKIMSLVDKFNIIGIAIDSQGGGNEIIDRLHSSKIVRPDIGQLPLWRFVDKDKPTDDDAEDGRHIIEAVNFSDSEYTSSANHGMRLDFENRTILFPRFDALSFAEIDLSIMENVKNSELMENATIEIEELKNELSSIVMTQTAHGRDRWDTPDEKLAGAKKGRLRKDRYSALLMANALAKKLLSDKPGPSYNYVGGFAQSVKRDDGEPFTMYSGSVLAKKLNNLYYGI